MSDTPTNIIINCGSQNFHNFQKICGRENLKLFIVDKSKSYLALNEMLGPNSIEVTARDPMADPPNNNQI
ncbi:MAG: hypothetical protein RL368_1429 [Pseudomonadota bacterium]|jgi:hypothetical protein